MAQPTLATRVFASRLYPLAPQMVSLAVLVLVLAFAFLGPPMGENNFAVVVTWQLWWLVLPISIIFLGRLWCAVCPIGFAGDLAQMVPNPRRHIPGAFLKKNGSWLMGSLFLAFFWVGMVRHICCWPVETGIVLLLFLIGAVAMGLAYQGRAWCRYICPVGIFTSLLSMAGLVGIRAKKTVCRLECVVDKRQLLRAEMQACPLYELPMAVDSNRYCNLCGNCVKFCVKGSMAPALLQPGKELWLLKKPSTGEAFFVATLVGAALIEALQTTQLFPNYMRWVLERGIFSSYDLAFTATIGATIAVVVGVYALASSLAKLLAGKPDGLTGAHFAYSLIPVALAGYLGVAIFRLANHGGRAVQVAVNQVAFSLTPFDLPPPVRGSFYSVDVPVKAVQLAILAIGTAAALYAAWRMAARHSSSRTLAVALSPMALVTASAAAILVMFVLPAGVILH